MNKPTGKLLFAYQTIATLEQKLDTLEAENAKLRAELERRAVPDGWKLVPFCVTSGMEDAYDDKCAEDGIEHELYMPAYESMLAAAPSAPKADDPVRQMLLEALELVVQTHDQGGWPTAAITIARAAIAAARQEGGKV